MQGDGRGGGFLKLKRAFRKPASLRAGTDGCDGVAWVRRGHGTTPGTRAVHPGQRRSNGRSVVLLAGPEHLPVQKHASRQGKST